MTTRFRLTTKRMVAVLVVAFAIIVASSQTLFAAPGGHSSSPSRTIHLSHGSTQTLTPKGVINTATLPTYHGSASQTARSLPVDRPRMTPAQLAAYQQWAKTHTNLLPHATGPAMSSSSPSFLTGTSPIPQLVRNADGINFTQSGCGCTPPDQAIAATPSAVFEGVNNLLRVDNATLSGVLAGPFTAQTFFGPVFHAGDFFSDPQITYIAERNQWVVVWLEINSAGTADDIDIAMSKNGAFSPLGTYLEYQVPASITGAGDFCDYPTVGYDFWGLWVSCVTFNGASGFIGNRVFVFSLNGLTSGSAPFTWFYNVPTDLNSGTAPAFRLSPVIEDGTPQAEFVIATDAAYGVLSQNLTLCAFSNVRAITTGGTPTASCDFNTLPLAYDDPVGATEPGGTVAPGLGTKQIQYRNGRIYFALPLASGPCAGSGLEDGIMWAAVDPQLTPFTQASPQLVNGIVGGYTNTGYWCFSNGDSYLPTLYPNGGDDDMTLYFNASNSVQPPSVYWTGRQAVDAPGTMGQTSGIGNNGGFGVVLNGTKSNTTGRFGDYSACTLLINTVDRGIVYCAIEYGGADVWNTRIAELRME